MEGPSAASKREITGYTRDPSLATSPELRSPGISSSESPSRLGSIFHRRASVASTSNGIGTRRGSENSVGGTGNLILESSSAAGANELNPTTSRDSSSSRSRLREWATRGIVGPTSPTRSDPATPNEDQPVSPGSSRRASCYGFFRRRNSGTESQESGEVETTVDDYVLIPRAAENSDATSNSSRSPIIHPSNGSPRTLSNLPPYEQLSSILPNSSILPPAIANAIPPPPPSVSTFPTLPRRTHFGNSSSSSTPTFSSVLETSATSVSQSETPSPSGGATLTRMRTLPRLLSSHGYPASTRNGDGSTTATEEEAQESDGSETDTDIDSAENSSSEGAEGAELNRRPTPLVRVSTPDNEHRQRVSQTTPRITSTSPLTSASPFQNAPPRAQKRPTRPVTASDRTPSFRVAPFASSTVSSSSWVAFPPPTSSPLASTSQFSSSAGYFDLPRQTANPRTPGEPMRTPLLPMSESSQARGRMPQYDTSTTPATMESPVRARRHSATELLTPGLGSTSEDEGRASLDEIWKVVGGPPTPGPSFLTTPAVPLLSPKIVPEAVLPKLSRPRSMYELHVAPPAYHSVYARPGHAQIVYPREDEGNERLPNYSCAIHIEGYMLQKKEFVQPNIQARDRTWRKVFLVLHGTAIKIYKYDLKSHPIPGEEDWSLVCADGPPSAHFHQNFESSTTTSAGATFLNEARGKVISRLPIGSSGGNTLLRHYSLQSGESGIAADYLKKKHVVRVRAEGEQFLLQCKDDRGVIDLIEALQAATNVSLDLDSRPLPKFITLGRRRRRRRRDSTAEVNAAIAAVENSVREGSRITAMLEEEQAVYAASRTDASVI